RLEKRESPFHKRPFTFHVPCPTDCQTLTRPGRRYTRTVRSAFVPSITHEVLLMPLPKMPTKPAALLSPKDFPKADKDKRVKPAIALVEPLPQPPAVEADKSVRAKAPGKVAEVPSASARSARSAATPITSGTR